MNLGREPAIRAAEIQRNPDAEVLRASLSDADSGVRARAAWALGRIGGDRAAAALAAALEDSHRAPSAAWLAGLAFLDPPRTMPGEPPEPSGVWRTLADGLWARYAVTEDEAMAEALLLAIARLGGRPSQRLLAADLAVVPSPEGLGRYAAAMQASAISCVRGHPLQRDGLRAIALGLTSSESRARQLAAYALGRCAGPSAEALAGPERGALVERLVPMVGAPEPEEARLAWRALAAVGETVDPVPVAILGAKPPPWIVEVEAVAALAGHADGRKTLAERLQTISLGAVEGPRVHVVLEALRGLRRAVDGTPELLRGLATLDRRLDAALVDAQGRRRKELGLLRCEVRVLQALRSGVVEPVSSCATGSEGLPATYGDVLVVDALLLMGSVLPREQKIAALLQRAADPRPAVAAPAVSGLADVDDSRVAPALREALMRPDPGVKAAAAASIAARSMDAARRDETVIPMLLETVSTLDNGQAVEARVAVIEALGHLARAQPKSKSKSGGAEDVTSDTVPQWLESEILALARDPAWAVRRAAREALLGRNDLLARFDAAVPAVFAEGFDARVRSLPLHPEASGLRLHTDAGTISISFDEAPAPVMQANLAKLAEQDYFDGLTFHRVVPGFVSQGGDPRGDGYGGPGWLVPCEWSTLRFRRGTVGIALAGKDTGGSQLFITHAPQPHLDARYTVIGRVTEGMDAVDSLLPHDRIREVEVLP